MRQNRIGRVQVHRRESAENVVQLREGIDDHENVARLEVRGVPEDHPARNAEIPYSIERAEVDHGVDSPILECRLVIGSPQAPQPGKLEQLLWEEETCDEEGLGRPEGQVGVVNVLHVWRAKHTILLSSKVDLPRTLSKNLLEAKCK